MIAVANEESHLWERARDLYVAGNLSGAEPVCKQLLDKNPKNFRVQCLIADIYLNSGRPNDAITHLQEAIRLIPEEVQPYYSLGVLHLNQGNIDKALTYSQQAIALKPDFVEAYVLLGTTLRRDRRENEAITAYRKAIALRPDFVDAHYNLGIALFHSSCYEEAIEQYQIILSITPDYADAYYGLGACLDALGKLDDAAACYEKGVQLNPANIEMWGNLAFVYLAQDRRQESLEAFRKAADLKHNHGRAITTPLRMVLHRIRHDAEQLRHLAKVTGIADQHRDYLAALSRLESLHTEKSGQEKVFVDVPTVRRIAASFNRIIHYANAPELVGGALNPVLDWRAIENAYLGSTPEIITIDDFLRPEAVKCLRQYCLESTVWKTVRPYGYMGTLLVEGFASPLLLQIISELRDRMPAILGKHNLTQAWAYKYDNSLQAINIHADCAVVNLNFWITPDEANLNPESGGLVVWDRAPPSEWGLMRTQNPDKTEIKCFLETSGARAIKVPYRQNRMVMFNSALFHKSDEMEFRDGYENRRMNVTLLYGSGLS